MFDDLQSKGQPKNNQPEVTDTENDNLTGDKQTGSAPAEVQPSKPVEDIFAQSENSSNPADSNPRRSQPTDENLNVNQEQPLPTMSFDDREKKRNGLLKVVLILFIIAVLGAGGYLGYRYYIENYGTNLNTDINNSDNNDNNATDSSDETDNTNIGNDSNNQAQVEDTDNDGLSDDEEFEYGTNIELPDTDNDGLFDREEVKIYNTDPLDQDSDNDGFMDGTEVRNGYDPNGPGRLYPENPSDF